MTDSDKPTYISLSVNIMRGNRTETTTISCAPRDNEKSRQEFLFHVTKLFSQITELVETWGHPHTVLTATPPTRGGMAVAE